MPRGRAPSIDPAQADGHPGPPVAMARNRTLAAESSDHLSLHRGAERRVLRLRNPGVPERTATHSLVVALQYLLPGEVAPAHRHSPSAIRFMLRGQGAYTTVDGQRCAMEPGDLVVTPSMAWHDHGNSGGQPTIWMDMLDWQVVRFLENLTYEAYPEDRQTEVRSPGRDAWPRRGAFCSQRWRATHRQRVGRGCFTPPGTPRGAGLHQVDVGSAASARGAASATRRDPWPGQQTAGRRCSASRPPGRRRASCLPALRPP